MTQNKGSGAASAKTTTQQNFLKNRDQEPDLIKAWKDRKDRTALATLTKNYQPLIKRFVRKALAGQAVTSAHRDDLMQECTIALITAVETFDPEKSPKLSTHAYTLISNTVKQYTLDYRAPYRIAKGSDERKAYYAAQRIKAKRAASNSVAISEQDIAEISKETGASLRATKRAVDAVQASQASLEEAHYNLQQADHGEEYLSSVAKDQAMEEVQRFLAGISERNRNIIKRSFMDDDEPSNSALSEEFEISSERVGQIKKEFLTKLRNHLHEVGLTAADIL